MEAAAQAIAQSGPVGWALLLTLTLVLMLLGLIMVASARVLRNAQKDMQHDINEVRKEVAVLRDENNKEFVELRRETAAVLGDVRERLGRLEGAAMLGAGVTMRRSDFFGERKP